MFNVMRQLKIFSKLDKYTVNKKKKRFLITKKKKKEIKYRIH